MEGLFDVNCYYELTILHGEDVFPVDKVVEKCICEELVGVFEQEESGMRIQASGVCILAWMALIPDRECRVPMTLAMVS